MARVLLFVVAIGLTIYALFDWIFRSRQRTPGGVNRWLWLAVIVLIPVAGPAAWIILSLVMAAESKNMPDNTDPVAPDDDPEYLREVAERIKRRQKRTRPDAPPIVDDDEDITESEDEDEDGSGKHASQ